MLAQYVLSPKGKEGVGQPCAWRWPFSVSWAAQQGGRRELPGKPFRSALVDSGSLPCEGGSS